MEKPTIATESPAPQELLDVHHLLTNRSRSAERLELIRISAVEHRASAAWPSPDNDPAKGIQVPRFRLPSKDRFEIKHCVTIVSSRSHVCSCLHWFSKCFSENKISGLKWLKTRDRFPNTVSQSFPPGLMFVRLHWFSKCFSENKISGLKWLKSRDRFPNTVSQSFPPGLMFVRLHWFSKYIFQKTKSYKISGLKWLKSRDRFPNTVSQSFPPGLMFVRLHWFSKCFSENKIIQNLGVQMPQN